MLLRVILLFNWPRHCSGSYLPSSIHGVFL